MIDLLKTVIGHQYDAALAMLHDCLETCPAVLWDGPVARYPFWQVAYHTLCFADLYLAPSEERFELTEMHPQGWAEFENEYPSRRFEKGELTAYAKACRAKARRTIANETAETLQGPSGFARRNFTRAELHVYNIRHIQHHAGQLGAYLRRMDPSLQEVGVLRWIGTAD
ncbi:MAG: DinB family protein [Phycisphaerae bacterium]|nr:DinB family protein [Phycisphaerae bacterium]